MKYPLKDALQFGWPGLKGYAYNSKDDFPHASAAFFEVIGSHGKVESTVNDRVYLVIEGEGEFEVAGERIAVKAMDVIIVPKKTPYDYKATGGMMKLFTVHVPAYDPKGDVNFDS